MENYRNENCLKGYECPECGAQGPFMIPTLAIVDWTDDGTGDLFEPQFADGHWECKTCGYRGSEHDFEIKVGKKCATSTK